jgi:integration host factor subunit alpha
MSGALEHRAGGKASRVDALAGALFAGPAAYGLAGVEKKVQNNCEDGFARRTRLTNYGGWRAEATPRLRLEMSNTRTGREPGKTVTRADLSEVVYQRVGLSRTESAELVQSVLDEICDAAVRGETVKLSGFGSFVVRSKGERIGRNPKTGVEVPILPRRVMVFKPSNVLKAKINGKNGALAKD